MRNLFLIFVIALIGGCGRGTATGNPIQHLGGSPSGSVAAIFTSVCRMIVGCHAPVTESQCLTGLSTMDSFASKLGIDLNPSPSTTQIVNLELNGDLSANKVVVDQCNAKLLDLKCTDQVLAGAYDPSVPQPFQGSIHMLDPVCIGVFGPRPDLEHP